MQITTDRKPERSVGKNIALAESPTVVVRKRNGIEALVALSTVGLFVIACSAAVYSMEAILMPITLAIIVGIVLGRAADELERFGLPPIFGGLLLALVFVLGLSSLVNALLGPITDIAREAPRLAEGVVDRILPFIERFTWLRMALIRNADPNALADALVKNAGPMLGTVAAGLTPALIQTLIFLAALVLFLLGRLQLRNSIILAFASRDRRLNAIRIMNATEDALAQYFSTASLIYLVLGVMTMVIAFVGGLTMAPLWGLFAFVSSFIPYLGVTFMTLSLLVGGLMTHDALLLGIAPAVAFFVVHLLMENLVVPAVVGHRFAVNPFLIFIAIIFWTWMWGAVGALLALPLSLIAMTVFEQVREPPAERQLPE
ncbi:AI-2E family transporter [Sinorhizobium terangae]|uniref:AI-2E family transporter n=1 Tax=Sinorhizobium terangae TaxID=110322 RepID=A0A6N7LBD7_SINTE|nr:AI-2E family transporter [Sinorhizobium terangae]MBB4184068.1 putative PurR-regulated permease PerM [Sinorhizobium terangae]MQX14916.1 AI-2E family transporter [Sinorhizobium terangae]WFU48170.1 AI-2E family transporter [Sinorhizobium terangae]